MELFIYTHVFVADTVGMGESDRNMMDNLLDQLRTGEVEVRSSRRRSRKTRRIDEEEQQTSDLSAAALLKSLEAED
jgi:hypothetical protein